MEYAIETHNLTKKFGDLVAVDGLSLRVRRGELFGFLGPNGAGKTTTIRMLCCLLRPTSGRAEINGFDVITDSLRVRSQIGLLPEFSNFYVEYSARYNVELMARLYGISRSESKRRKDELFDLFDLKGREHDPVGTFSRGMERRLAMAAALIHRPSILFLDELTSGLDVHSARVIRETVKRLSSEGVTIFLTTHRIEDAQELCQRIGIIDLGKPVAVGTLDHLRREAEAADVIELTLANRNSACTRLFGGIDGVKGSTWQEENDSLRLTVEEGDRTLPRILEVAVKNRVSIMSARLLKPSLEDVFVRLTGKPLKEEGAELDSRLLVQKGRGVA